MNKNKWDEKLVDDKRLALNLKKITTLFLVPTGIRKLLKYPRTIPSKPIKNSNFETGSK